MSNHQNPYKIFLIEDNELELNILLKYLNENNYIVYWADSYKDALKTINKIEEIDIFLFDLHLENELESISLISKLKKKSKMYIDENIEIERKTPPVIIITKDYSSISTNKAYKQGVSHYIKKDLHYQGQPKEDRLKEIDLIIQNLMKQRELSELRLKYLHSEESALKIFYSNDFFSDFFLRIQSYIIDGKKDIGCYNKAIQLLGLYRNISVNIMSLSGHQVISLSEEVELIEKYLEMFGLYYDISISLNIDDIRKRNLDKSIFIPPLIIFPLIQSFITSIKDDIQNCKKAITIILITEIISEKEFKFYLNKKLDENSSNAIILDKDNNSIKCLFDRLKLFNLSNSSSTINDINLLSENKNITALLIKYTKKVSY